MRREKVVPLSKRSDDITECCSVGDYKKKIGRAGFEPTTLCLADTKQGINLLHYLTVLPPIVKTIDGYCIPGLSKGGLAK